MDGGRIDFGHGCGRGCGAGGAGGDEGAFTGDEQRDGFGRGGGQERATVGGVVETDAALCDQDFDARGALADVEGGADRADGDGAGRDDEGACRVFGDREKHFAPHDAHAALAGGESGVDGGVGVELGDGAVGQVEFLERPDGGLGGVARGAGLDDGQHDDRGRGGEADRAPDQRAVVAGRVHAGREQIRIGCGGRR